MAALQNDLAFAEVLGEALPLFVGRDQAFIVVVADRPKPHRILIATLNEPLLLHRYRGHVFGVQMDDALRLRIGVVDALVEREREFVRYLVARHDMIAFVVELVQARGGDFLEQKVRRMHEELVRVARHARRQMRDQTFVPIL